MFGDFDSIGEPDALDDLRQLVAYRLPAVMALSASLIKSHLRARSSVYRTRFFGHKAALCGLLRGDRCGHPVPPCFGGASVAVLFQEPVLVVAIEVRPDGGADLLDVLEDASENDLLLQRADEALGDAVGFRLTDESEAGRHAEEPQLVLEVLGHERAAVVVTQQHPARGIRADGSEDLADGQRQRLSGGVTVAVLGDMPAEALGVPVLGDDEQRDVAVLRPSG